MGLLLGCVATACADDTRAGESEATNGDTTEVESEVESESEVEVESGSEVESEVETTTWPYPLALFYQTVAQTGNEVRVGWTYDGETIVSSGDTTFAWVVLGGQTQTYGDPVLSRLANGTWAATAWSGRNDPRGASYLMYQEASCPKDLPAPSAASIKFIGPQTPTADALCKEAMMTIGGKSSQVFDVDGSNYLFLNSGSSIYLVRMTNGASTGAPDAICFLKTPATDLAAMRVGDATEVIARGVSGAIAEGDGPLVLSDAGIARRKDGTWVLFVKGFSKALAETNSCRDLCELCNRGVYRATSSDLLHWSALDRVAWRASIPEASVDPLGRPWLYYQDFGAACDANDHRLANRAAISGIREEDDVGTMSTPIHVYIEGASFETNTQEHYPTNGNPVRLSGPEALSALESCTP